MKKDVIKLLENESVNFTKNNQKIANYIIKNEPNIAKIMDLKDNCNVSLSSAHRFIKTIGYPTFTHFLWDYNGYNNKRVKNENDYHHIIEKAAKNFAQEIKGKKIFIVTSRRAKSLGKFFLERLNDGGIDNLYFSESQMNLNEYLRKTQNGALLVFDLTGHSHTIEKTNEILRTSFFKNKKPKFMFISASNSKIIRAYKHHFSIGEIENKNFAIKNWQDYNDIILRLFEFLHQLLKYIYIYNKQEK